jgi:DNA polymerase-4
LSIAHVDADSFYASVEKRDNPDLINKPVIVGSKAGRGIVTTACYVARKFGVKSAMPMYKALQVCPDAIVVAPDFEKYKKASREIHAKMLALTPDVQTLSLDEAFLDLSSTKKFHGRPPAFLLAQLAEEIKRDVGITVSVGLSHSLFLAKIASDLQKPFGFSVVGKEETLDFLKNKPVGIISGVGQKTQEILMSLGITQVGHLRDIKADMLQKRLGTYATQLIEFSNGVDTRKVVPNGPAKSISNETTFERDITSFEDLKKALWPLCEKVSGRLKKEGIMGDTITLKLKTSDHKSISRQVQGPSTQLAEVLYKTGCDLLSKISLNKSYRLIGIGVSGFEKEGSEKQSVLFQEEDEKSEIIERTLDEIRKKWGNASVYKGRSVK